MKTTTSPKCKARNTITGLYYVDGQGFIEANHAKATPLDASSMAVVRYTFLYVEDVPLNRYCKPTTRKMRGRNWHVAVAA